MHIFLTSNDNQGELYGRNPGTLCIQMFQGIFYWLEERFERQTTENPSKGATKTLDY